MTDDVKVLFAEARVYADKIHRWAFGDDSELVDRAAVRFAVERITDALEAATVAPAVDPEALATALARLLDSDEYGGCDCGNVSPRCAPALAIDLIASGLFRDVRDVQAEALEQAANSGDFNTHACIALNRRAQAIREARNER